MKAMVLRIALATVLAGSVPPVFGHHSTASYDTATPVTFKGVVTSVRFRNPHVRIYVDVPDSNGRIVNWDVETWGTGQMSLRGLTDGFLKPGDHVSLDAFVAKDGSSRAFVRHLVLPGGSVVDGPPFDKN
jgi:WD40 repeat protein